MIGLEYDEEITIKPPKVWGIREVLGNLSSWIQDDGKNSLARSLDDTSAWKYRERGIEFMAALMNRPKTYSINGSLILSDLLTYCLHLQ